MTPRFTPAWFASTYVYVNAICCLVLRAHYSTRFSVSGHVVRASWPFVSDTSLKLCLWKTPHKRLEISSG